MSSLRHLSPRLAARFVTRGILGAAMVAVVAAAENPAPAPVTDGQDPDKQDPTSFLSGNDLFPDNSILKGVILPSYNLDLQLTNTVTAEELTIVTKKNIAARNVKIEFFGPQRTPRGAMSLQKAKFDAETKLLTTTDPVSFVSDKMNVDGSAMVFDTEHSRGFLYGPVKAVHTAAPLVSMNASPTRRALATGALLMASAVQVPAQGPQIQPPVPAAAPQVVTPAPLKDRLQGLTLEEKIATLQPDEERLKQIKADAASRAPQAETARAAADKVLAEGKEKSEDARITMNRFFKAAALTSLIAEPAPEATAPVPRPVLEAPKEGAEKTTITSDGGAFMDDNEGLIVFMKNVKVVNPEFTLTAQKEVKAFMKKDPNSDKSEAEQREDYRKMAAQRKAERDARDAAAAQDGTVQPPPAKEGEEAVPTPLPKPPEGAVKPAKPVLSPEKLAELKAKKDKMKAAGMGGEGDISRLIASGTVLIDYQPKDEGKEGETKKKPVKAAAHLAVYDFEREEILLQGGQPWVMIGKDLFAVDNEDSYIQITLEDGRPAYAVTKGGSLRAELELRDMKDKSKEGDKAKDKEKDAGKQNNGPKPANNGAKPNNR